MKKSKEISIPISQEDDQAQLASEAWQEEFEEEMRYKDELLYEGALIERKRILVSLRKFLEQEEHAPVKPINTNDYKDPDSVKELLKVEGIDVIRLVDELEKLNFFESKYRIKLISWFRGSLLRGPIPIMVSADTFVSLIADMMDAKPSFIKNSKEIVYTHIAISFKFKGKKCKIDTIKQIMKPSTHKNRISYKTGKIPNIQNYILKSTT